MNVRFQKHCPECRVKCGQVHREGCDVERCPYCGMQALSCGCAPRDLETFTGILPADRLPWEGSWPGEREAVAFGWAVKPDRGWVPCSPNDPNARPDINRLHEDATWDPKRKQFVKKARSQKATQELESST